MQSIIWFNPKNYRIDSVGSPNIHDQKYHGQNVVLATMLKLVLMLALQLLNKDHCMHLTLQWSSTVEKGISSGMNKKATKLAKVSTSN